MAMNHEHVGLGIDDFLKEEGIFEEAQTPGRSAFWCNISSGMAKWKLSRYPVEP